MNESTRKSKLSKKEQRETLNRAEIMRVILIDELDALMTKK